MRPARAPPGAGPSLNFESKQMATEKQTTVTVGCKLPHGLHLDLYDTEGNLQARETIVGLNQAEVVGGHGITMGVPKAHFDEWMRRNKNSAAVKNELIFAHESAQNTIAQANANAKNKSGFEGLDPAKPGMGVEKDDGK